MFTVPDFLPAIVYHVVNNPPLNVHIGAVVIWPGQRRDKSSQNPNACVIFQNSNSANWPIYTFNFYFLFETDDYMEGFDFARGFEAVFSASVKMSPSTTNNLLETGLHCQALGMEYLGYTTDQRHAFAVYCSALSAVKAPNPTP